MIDCAVPTSSAPAAKPAVAIRHAIRSAAVRTNTPVVNRPGAGRSRGGSMMSLRSGISASWSYGRPDGEFRAAGGAVLFTIILLWRPGAEPVIFGRLAA